MSWLPDWLTGYDSENAQAAAEADARLRALNQQAAADFGSEWSDQVEKNYATQEPFGESAQREAIGTAFTDSLNQSAKTGVGFFGTLLAPLKAILKAIPLWVWLLAALGVFIWLGGGGFLARKARGRLSA